MNARYPWRILAVESTDMAVPKNCMMGGSQMRSNNVDTVERDSSIQGKLRTSSLENCHPFKFKFSPSATRNATVDENRSFRWRVCSKWACVHPFGKTHHTQARNSISAAANL